MWLIKKANKQKQSLHKKTPPEAGLLLINLALILMIS